MKRAISIATATVLVPFPALTVRVGAQQPDTRDRTIMTFSGPVELPGLRLEAGTYVFRLADSASRNVIQVLSEDEMQMLGQWLFVPAERQEVTGDTVVTFRETRANATPAVQFWFYPGEKIGKEFIYPKDQAVRIAQRTGATVLTEDGAVSAGAQATAQGQTQIAPAQEQGALAVQRQGIGVVEGSGLPAGTQAETETARADVGRASTQGQSAAAVGTTGRDDQAEVTAGAEQEPSVARDQTFAGDELPRTASPLALSGLLALIALAGAAGVRTLRK